MCIRDRWGSAEGRLSASAKLIGALEYDSKKDGWNGPFKICLLYTSDAADERSSVDLGGRRIIKKKKRWTLGGSIILTTKNKHKTDLRESTNKRRK